MIEQKQTNQHEKPATEKPEKGAPLDQRDDAIKPLVRPRIQMPGRKPLFRN